MRGRTNIFRYLLFWVATVTLPTAAQDAPGEGPAAGADRTRASVVERASREDVEEVVITERAPGRGKIPTLELISEVYDARRQGGWLYRRGRYEEAFPLLLTAAKRGFKFAQARVGFLYQQGCQPRQPCEWGGPNGKINADAAVGWLALAAKPPTTPEIRGHFKELWQRIPAQHHARFNAVIATYEQRYGTAVNRVGCDRSHQTGTYSKHVICRFVDEPVFTGEDISRLLDEFEMSRVREEFNAPVSMTVPSLPSRNN